MSLAVLTLIFASAVASSFQLLRVEGESMENTLHEGDLLLVRRIKSSVRWFGASVASIRRGTVIVLANPRGGRTLLVKRVAALGGERIKIEEGHVLVDGSLSEYAARGIIRKVDSWGWFEGTGEGVLVPKGEYFVLSDNRGIQSDSRLFGSVSPEWVTGVVLAVW